jgi:hypothetical protein
LGRAIALLLALGLGAGCTHVRYVGGEYRLKRSDHVSITDKTPVIDKGRWEFFWGLLVPEGKVNIHRELAKQLRPNEALVDIDVERHVTVGGAILWFFTGGIVSHHETVVTARRTVVAEPEPETPPLEPGAAEPY